jgi:hypothetical protein
MAIGKHRSARIALVVGAFALVITGWACGSNVSDEARSTDAAPVADVVEPASAEHDMTAPVSEHSSNRQPGADDMRVAIVSPTDGSTFSNNVLPLVIDTNGFDLSLAGMGKGDTAGQGHLHVYLDDVLVNYYATPRINISMQNKEPGDHTIKVVPSQNSHREIDENAETIEVNWQPTSPPPVVQPANFAGEPSVQILDPEPDATVGDAVKVRINVKSFNLSTDLMGKDGVDGYGHWHAFLATGTPSDDDPGSLLMMGASREFTLNTAGLEKGAIYTLVVQLTENGHSPISGASDSIQIRIA